MQPCGSLHKRLQHPVLQPASRLEQGCVLRASVAKGPGHQGRLGSDVPVPSGTGVVRRSKAATAAATATPASMPAALIQEQELLKLLQLLPVPLQQVLADQPQLSEVI